VAVERAVEILFLLAERGEATVSELAHATGSGPSAVHRILTALQRKGLVEQASETRRYRLSWTILALGRSVGERVELRALALPHMTALRDLSGETVTLNVRSGFQRICVECVESPHELRWRAEIGRPLPLFSGASGKALLAALGDHDLERYLATVPREPLTPYTQTTRAALLAEVRRIRRRGYCLAGQDRVPGLAGVSAAVGEAGLAALTIAGPVERCTRPRLAAWARPLLAATRTISGLLGAEPGPAATAEKGAFV
jgi:IclR family acetate operon transcriptional repressor